MIKTYTAMPAANPQVALNTLTCEPSQPMKIHGIIQIVHGMTEHIDRYEAFAEYFTSKGYVVVGHDLEGHGRSKNPKSSALYFEQWENNLTDIKTVRTMIRKKYPKEPIFILGFSLGSFLVRCMGDDLQNYDGQILAGTGYQSTAVLSAMRFYLKTKYRKHMAMPCEEIKKLAFDQYNTQFKERPEDYWLITDDRIRNEYNDDHLVNKSFSPQFFCEFLKGMVIANHNVKHLDSQPPIPTLLIHGKDDPVAGTNYEANIVDRYRKQCIMTSKSYSYHTHDIMHDVESELVFQDIEKFIFKHAIG